MTDYLRDAQAELEAALESNHEPSDETLRVALQAVTLLNGVFLGRVQPKKVMDHVVRIRVGEDYAVLERKKGYRK